MEDFVTYGYTQFVTEGTTFNISVTTSTSFATTSVTTTQNLVTTTQDPVTEIFPSSTELLTISRTSSEPDDEFVFDSYPQRVFIAALLLIATIIGTIGNGLVILAVLFAQKLHTVTNVFVFNLAVADLLVSLSLPWNAVALLAKDGWPLPPFFCSAAAGIVVVCVGCSVFTLASIAITRLIIITKSRQWYNKIFTRKVLCIWIGFTWILPFVVGVIPTFAGFGQLGYNPKYHACSSISTAPHSDEYDILTTVVFFPVSLLIMVVSYATIFSFVRKHTKKFDRTRRETISNTRSTTLPVPGSSAVSHADGSSGFSSNRQIIREERADTSDAQQVYLQITDDKRVHLQDAELEADSTDADILMDENTPSDDTETTRNNMNAYTNPDESLINEMQTSLSHSAPVAHAGCFDGDVSAENPKQVESKVCGDSANPLPNFEISVANTDNMMLPDHTQVDNTDASKDKIVLEIGNDSERHCNEKSTNAKDAKMNVDTNEHSERLPIGEDNIPLSESTQNILKEIDSETVRAAKSNGTDTRKLRTDVFKNITFPRPKLSDHEIEITKNMFYVVVAFLISFTPFTFCMIIDTSDPFLPYATAVVFINSCINPIIYAIKHRNFKTTFRSIVRCRLGEIIPPSIVLRTLIDKGVCGCRNAHEFPA
ncbi:uncharacterized protein [Amphiura filiformis]|uniref:uncharacterized protein n=1 Tax=Amphiura filiformis TaxID=82378 RepID=UPI003B21686C